MTMPTSKAMEVAKQVDAISCEAEKGRMDFDDAYNQIATLIDQHTAQLVQETRNAALVEARKAFEVLRRVIPGELTGNPLAAFAALDRALDPQQVINESIK